MTHVSHLTVRRLARGGLLAASLLAPATAFAHPHVFAEAKMEIVGAPDGTLAAVRNIWRMDELFSSSVVVDFDKNANGRLDDDELVEVGETVRESIAEWNFYTLVESDGQEKKMGAPDEIRTLWENGQLLMFFEMKPAEAVPLAGHKLVFSAFDESYFVAFDFAAETDFQLVSMPASCTRAFVVPDEDEAAKDWMNSVATLGPDQTLPDDGINYSQALATRAEVACPAAG